MTAISHVRGHACYYTETGWEYCDNGVSIGEEERACKRCGEWPTPEGYDACLGYIAGAAWACCGHGVKPKRVMDATMAIIELEDVA